jgi:hypothetical protein
MGGQAAGNEKAALGDGWRERNRHKLSLTSVFHAGVQPGFTFVLQIYYKACEEGLEDMPHRVNICKIPNSGQCRPAKEWRSILSEVMAPPAPAEAALPCALGNIE